jgi:outer membrane protein, multidrug efflux system
VINRFSISILIFLPAILFLGGCTLGPKYNRPAADVPATFRGLPDNPSADLTATSAGDVAWATYFQDVQLQSLIQTALKNNFDLRIAATRVLQAQAVVGITRADQYPNVSGGAMLGSTRTSRSRVFPENEVTNGQLTVNATWSLDFWGKYRNATASARASLVASEWGQREVVTTLISSVAAAYFTLRAYDLQLEISEDALQARQESLRLTTALANGGATSLLDVRQAEQLVYTASSEIPDLQRLIQQQENFISILIGSNPASVPRGLALIAQPHAPQIPAGLPSALLERRPDIRQAEEQLIAANFQIAVARAAYFPDISLTAAPGLQSDALTNLFSGPAGIWTFAASAVQPIFTAGRIHSNIVLTQAQRDQALLSYQQTIQGAFRDVSNALIGYQKDQEFRTQQDLLTEAAKDAARLSNIRYNGGATSYLEVLTNETNYFSARLNQAQAELNELLSYVQLYQSLAGGWQNNTIQPAPTPPIPQQSSSNQHP